MKRKSIIYIFILIALAIGVYAFVGNKSGTSESEYQFTKITRGDLESTISATGTLTPVTTVDVGTQVSGTIDSVYVDFNDHVTEGQILAVLDTAMLKASVIDAEANVEKAEASLEQAEADYSRSRALFERQMISDADYQTAGINVKLQKASLKSARAALERVRKNLEYAVIRSPISGIVIARKVESGQTVAASLSTPTLFQIAENLSRMEILAEVDEGDIGQVKEGQDVRFEVQAYSSKEFHGIVSQVRLEPTTISNVVTYTVVIETANNDGLLLPGMTATIDFITQDKSDVLLVANKALRYKPSDEQLKAAMDRRRAEMQTVPDSVKQPRRERFTGRTPQEGDNMGQLWYLEKNGQLVMEPVQVGMSDGINTEIIIARSLTEGSEVISGTGSSSASTASNSSSSNGPRFGPRGF